jgi:hypothetical protein
VEVIDLGLRLVDVRELDLQAEEAFDKGSVSSRRWNLQQNGATPEEVEFLLTQRVELNALASHRLVAFIESKLEQHGVKKIVPDDELLAATYRLAIRNREIEKIVAQELKKQNITDATAPSDLTDQVREYLTTHPQARWDEAVKEIADDTSVSTIEEPASNGPRC